MNILVLSDFLPDANLTLSKTFLSKLKNAEAIIYNLEGSPQIVDKSKNVPIQIMPFEVDEVIRFMSQFGLEKFHVALANNHILDNGLEAFDYLVKKFKSQNIKFFGTKEFPFTVINHVAILNFVTGETVAKKNICKSRLNYLFYDTDEINQQIKNIESQFEKLILYPHWGRDMDTTIFKTYDNRLRYDKKWLVFGHHPHVISGVEKDRIYSMGNNYIPHPYYFDNYPATHFGLAVELNSHDFIYNVYLTTLLKYDDKYQINIEPYYSTPDLVLVHGNNFSTIKKIFLKIFSFKGNTLDVIKLNVLQGLTSLFALKYRLFKSKK